MPVWSRRERGARYLIHIIESVCILANYDNMPIIASVRDATDLNINYIVVPRQSNSPATVILQKYKSSDKYGRVEHIFTHYLSGLLRQFITTKQLNYGDLLFGKTKIGIFVNIMNLVAEISDESGKRGINFLRHSKISTELKTVKSADERLALSVRMQHHFATQLNYVRQLK